ncbi:PRC-barrel domain-containing protein [Agromyces bauzanensis]
MNEPQRQPRRHPAGRVIDAMLHLLDRQVLDRDGVPVTTVDDLELDGIELGAVIDPEGPRPKVTAILTGPNLATRIFGGRPPSSRYVRIPWRLVSDVGTTIRLGVTGDSLDATWVERWIATHIIGRIPGGRHDPD